MKQVLINLVHPNLKESRVNKALANEVSVLKNVTINNLYKKYPEFKINAQKEQELLLGHDVIVFQFPMYWFNSPALLKQWFDTVFDYNFAYGDHFKLEGKAFVVATSTGAAEKEYCATGNDGYTVKEFLLPFQGIAKYTKMHYDRCFVTYTSLTLSDAELKTATKNYFQYIKELSVSL